MSVIVEKILALYESRGGATYSWDRVSETGHALQTATQALQAGPSDALVIAALLHDVGREGDTMVRARPQDCALCRKDARGVVARRAGH